MRVSGHERVRLLLSADQLLVKNIQLPMAIEENLREAVGFELDRYTPFRADQAYYDVRVLRRDGNKETVEVQLGVAPRAVVDPLLATLRGLELSVGAIGAAPGVAGGGVIDLLPAADRPAQKWGKHLKLNAALFALVVVLALLALLFPIWQKREKVLELIPQVSKASTEFSVSQKQYDEYSKIATHYNYITGRKFSQQPVLVLLEELSKISPDTTYVQSLEIKLTGKIRELTLIGEAQSASRVLEVLEQSPLFQNAAQRAQTTRGSQPNTERYHVSTEIKSRPLPPTAIAGMAEPVAPVVAPAVPALPVQTSPVVEPGANIPATGAASATAAPAAQLPAPAAGASTTTPVVPAATPAPIPGQVPPKAPVPVASERKAP
jgi:general secretion pathway protein L